MGVAEETRMGWGALALRDFCLFPVSLLPTLMGLKGVPLGDTARARLPGTGDGVCPPI